MKDEVIIDSKNVFSNLLWRFAEKWSTQIASFIVSVILSRLLIPEDYGVVTIVLAIISVFSTFTDFGLGTSLIQKKDPDDLDFSTVFFTNIILCVIFYLILFLICPLINKIYNIPNLSLMIRVCGLTIIISAIKNVQHAYISKKMMFKKFFYASLIGTVLAEIIGIVTALNGFGVWSLIFLNVLDMLFDTIIIWFSVEWRPKRLFSFDRLRNLLNYGWKIFASRLSDSIYSKLHEFIIGAYSLGDLAFYDKGSNLASKITINIDSAINSVLFPVMAKKQDDAEEVKKIAKRLLKTNTYVVTPLLLGFAAVANPLVELLYTGKWLNAVIYIRIFCLINIFEPIQTANLNVIRSMGKSDIFLKLEIIKKIVGISVLLLTVRFGVLAMAIGCIFSSFICQIINSYPNKELINYPYSEQIVDILPTLLLGLFMFIGVYFINFEKFGLFFDLIFKIIVGAIIYIGGSLLLKIDSFDYILTTLRKIIKEKNDKAR